MTDNKYTAMMRGAEDECKCMAVANEEWPEIAEDNLIEAADWRAMREAWEAMVEALDTALEYARHSEGCSRPHGEQYSCRCRWDEERPKCEAALAEARVK